MRLEHAKGAIFPGLLVICSIGYFLSFFMKLETQLWLAAGIMITALGLAFDGWLTLKIEERKKKNQQEKAKAPASPQTTEGDFPEE